MSRYGIGIVYGLGAKDNSPETHALSKLRKLSQLLDSDEVGRVILAGGEEADVSKEHLISKMRVPQQKIYTDRGGSFVNHMYSARKTIRRWVRDSEIPAEILLHHIVQTWAVERAYFDAEWVIPTYPFVVHGVEDGRSEEVVYKVDLKEEPTRMRIDQLSSKIPILSRYRPDMAQLVASCRYPSAFLKYGRRFLPV